MKSRTFFAIITLIICTQSFGQERGISVETNPIFLLGGGVNVGLEKAVSEKQSFQFIPFFIYSNGAGSKETGAGFTMDYRFYSKEALDGFYFGPVTTYGSFSSKDDFGDAKGSLFGIGVKIGWNWLLGKNDNFVIDLGLGGAHYSINANGYFNFQDFGGSSDENFNGIGPVLNFTIGQAF